MTNVIAVIGGKERSIDRFQTLLFSSPATALAMSQRICLIASLLWKARYGGWWERRCWRAWQQWCWYDKSIVGDPVLLHEKMSTMLIRLQLWSSLFEKMMTMTGMIMLTSDSTAGNPALLYQKMKTMLTILMRVQFYCMKRWQRWQCWREYLDYVVFWSIWYFGVFDILKYLVF